VNPRDRRLGENEILYREVNERMLDLHDRFGLDDDYVEFVCECSRIDCNERLRLTTAEYEHVRESGRHFALRHGHEEPSIESVVEENDRFVMVEKDEGEPAELARATDPR
jgi:hypothetical protein